MLPPSRGTKRSIDLDIDPSPRSIKVEGSRPTRSQQQLHTRPPSRKRSGPSRPTNITLEGTHAYRPWLRTVDTFTVLSVFLVQPRMLGVPDPPRSFRLPDLVHLSSFAPVQGYIVGTGARALPCYSLARLLHLYFFLFHCLYCISFKGDRLILPHAQNIIVTDSPVDLLCGH